MYNCRMQRHMPTKVVVISITWLISLIDIWYISDIFEQNIKQKIIVCKNFVNKALQLKLSCNLPLKIPFLLSASHKMPGLTLSVYLFSVCTVWIYLYWNTCLNKCFKFYVFDQKIKKNIRNIRYQSKYHDIFQNMIFFILAPLTPKINTCDGWLSW